MDNFNFKSQPATSIEQSERLLALGLKKETADMVWLDHAMTEEYEDWKVTPVEEWDDWNECDIPAWSLHRLIEMMPKIIGRYFQYTSNDGCGYMDEEALNMNGGFCEGNIYDSIISCIEWLIKKGYFNKEYLEE